MTSTRTIGARTPGVRDVLRHGAMDLLSAAAFLGIWLARTRLEYDTLRMWLLWPVVFEAFLAGALFLAGMGAGFRHAAARVAWLAFFSLLYLAGAWLAGEQAGMPQAWLAALWLWTARGLPPRGAAWATREHVSWIAQGAGYAGLLWGAGFVLTAVLMLVVSGPTTADADGTLHSQTPAWVFPLVWVPYFVAEGIVRAWRTARREAPLARR